MDHMVIWHLGGICEERILNRARENYLEYALQEPIDAMRQKDKKVTSMLVSGREVDVWAL
jgi:hypothetical protein